MLGNHIQTMHLHFRTLSNTTQLGDLRCFKLKIENTEQEKQCKNQGKVKLQIFKPSHEAYDVIHHIEELLRTKTGSSLIELLKSVGVLKEEALALSSRLPSFCGLKEKIIRRFIRLRLRIEAKKEYNMTGKSNT